MVEKIELVESKGIDFDINGKIYSVNLAEFKTLVKYNKVVKKLEELKGKVEKDNFEVEATRIINYEIDDILNDLQIDTEVKTKLGEILFSDLPIKKKRIEVRKLKYLDKKFEKLFLKLLEYIEQV